MGIVECDDATPRLAPLCRLVLWAVREVEFVLNQWLAA